MTTTTAQELIAAITAAALCAPLKAAWDDKVTFKHVDPHGTTCAYSIPNCKENLQSFALKVKANASAFDGKTRKTAKPKTVAASPLTAAREMIKGSAFVEALQIVESLKGGAIFCKSINDGLPGLCSIAATAEFEGEKWAIVKHTETGRLHALHVKSGKAADHTSPVFKACRSASDMLAKLEQIYTDAAHNQYKCWLRTNIAKTTEFDQAAARHAFICADGARDIKDANDIARNAYAEFIATRRINDHDTSTTETAAAQVATVAAIATAQASAAAVPTTVDAETCTAGAVATVTIASASAKRTPIGDIRRAVDSCNWSRHDVTGGTPDEFIRQDVRARLAPKIERLQELRADIPPSKAADLQSLDSAIEHAHATIARWEAARATTDGAANTATPKHRAKAKERRYEFPNAFITIKGDGTCLETPKWCQIIQAKRSRKYTAEALMMLRAHRKATTATAQPTPPQPPSAPTMPTTTPDTIEHGQDYAGQDLSGWHATEKIDGVRAYWDGATLYSRSAKPCPVPDWLAHYLPEGVALDCELYAGPGDAGRMRAAVAIKYGRITPGMVLYVHDMPGAPGCYAQRMRAADMLLTDAVFNADDPAAADPVQVLSVTTATSTADAVEMMRATVAKGGEGLMLRAPGHTYRPGRHAWGAAARLCKLKPDPDGTIGHGIN